MREKCVLYTGARAAFAALAILASPRTAAGDTGDCVDDAASRHRDAAMTAAHPTTGLDATVRYLERLNELASNPSFVSCFDVIASDAPKLRDTYCASGSKLREADGCVLLDKIQLDILRVGAQKQIEKADRANEADKASRELAQPLYLRAGETYLDTHRQFCAEPVKEGRPLHVADSTCEEMAYNAGRAFAAAHDAPKAMAALQIVIAEDQRTKRHSVHAARAMYELGGWYQRMAVYDQAADWYERFAALHPKALGADSALSDAVILRLGLGQEAQATRDAADFAKNWGITQRKQSAAVLFAIAAHHAERGEKDKARAVLGGAMASLDRGPADLTIRAHALAAQVAASPAIARSEWAAVRAAWSDPAKAEQDIRRGWSSEAEGQVDRRVAKVVNAVGEAYFAAAEEKRIAEVASLKVPAYARAPINRANVLGHAQKTLPEWLAKKRAAIEHVEAEYMKILELRPVPPPRWVIAAGSAIGAMWGDFADELRRMPPPDGLGKDPALLREYVAAVTSASEPILTGRAKPAMKKCADLSVKYLYSDERSRACFAWLESHYEKEYRHVDELVPQLRATTFTAGLGTAPALPAPPEPSTPPDR